MTGFSVEHRTARSYGLRIQSCKDWDNQTAIDITALPARWFTNDPADLHRIAQMANDAANWLEKATECCDDCCDLPHAHDVAPNVHAHGSDDPGS